METKKANNSEIKKRIKMLQRRHGQKNTLLSQSCSVQWSPHRHTWQGLEYISVKLYKKARP